MDAQQSHYGDSLYTITLKSHFYLPNLLPYISATSSSLGAGLGAEYIFNIFTFLNYLQHHK